MVLQTSQIFDIPCSAEILLNMISLQRWCWTVCVLVWTAENPKWPFPTGNKPILKKCWPVSLNRPATNVREWSLLQIQCEKPQNICFLFVLLWLLPYYRATAGPHTNTHIMTTRTSLQCGLRETFTFSLKLWNTPSRSDLWAQQRCQTDLNEGCSSR